MTWTTPPKLAREWGVEPAQVIRWIKSGDLVGHDLRRPGSTRPHWRISSESIEAFLNARRSQKPLPKVRKMKIVKDKDWVEYVK